MHEFQMVKWLIASSAIALAACGESVTNTDTQSFAEPVSGWTINPPGDLNDFFECLEAEGATLVSAHRGGPGRGYPENALETMAATLGKIPAIMEIDVATSADGILYLMHDDTLERATTGSGETSALNWAGVKKLRLKDKNGMATTYAPTRFDAALAWADGRTILQVDFKRTTRYGDVAAEIKRQGAEDRIILIAYSIRSAAKLHRLLPEAMISVSLNSQSELNRAVAAGVPADKILGFTGAQSPRPRLFSILNGRDVEVIFATLGGRDSIDEEIARSGDFAQYADIAGAGADIIATDRPLKVHAALAEAGRAVADGVCGVTEE
jgi:glycerophosphoryl diester phosphodiesterase